MKENDLPPIAWTMFKSRVDLPKSAWPEIINRAVNHGIDNSTLEPRPGDPWLEWPRSGVCHDKAATKWLELIRHGYHPNEMRFCFVRIPDGRDHVVLLVGGQVLDSLTDVIKTEAEMRLLYRVVRTQSADDPDDWPYEPGMDP